jgi:hypothetical protein
MISFFLFTKRFLEKHDYSESVLKYFYYGMFVIALLGVWQFININSSLGISFLSDWTWATHLNPSISGWGMAYDKMAYIGSINRAASFAHEPAHLALFLIGVSGISLLVLLRDLRFPNEKKITNLFFAFVILAAFIFTFSITGFLSFSVVVVAYIGISRNASFKFMLVLFFIVLPFYIITNIFLILPDIGQKISSVYTVFFCNDLSISGEAVSALTSMLHTKITLLVLSDHPFWGVGIGRYIIGHSEYSPIAFQFFPSYPYDIVKMNANDASSLLYRMLSETGLVSTSVFAMFIILIFRQSLYRIGVLRELISKDSYLVTLGLILSSIGYMISHFLRMGAYHYIEFWLLLAMVSSINHNRSFMTKFSLNREVL